MRWHTKPITQLVVMLVVMSVVIGAQSTASTFLANDTQNKFITKDEDTGLRKVAGTIPDPTCPNTDAVNYAWTENNTAIAPPRRMRYTDAPWEYNSLNETYYARTQEFDQAGFGTKAQNLAFMADDQNDDKTGGTQGTGVTNFMSSMFRYKPTAFKNAYILKYTSAVVRDDPSLYKGDSPAIEVPSKAGWPVCMPTTGYDIGGGYEAMVVSVDSNRITLHIGIHEYMDGRNDALGGCPPGEQCRGGYWLYISGINVDSDIVAAYNEKKGVQQGASLAKEISTRIELPIVKPGRRLGTSQGDGVTVLLRDSGPIIYANKNFMWGGGFPEYDAGTPANTPPPTGAATPISTNTPIPSTPTPAPTGTTPAATPNPALPCGHGLWRYTCSESGTFINEARCIEDIYTLQGSSSSCSPGTSCPSLTVNYSATQLPNFGAEYCAPNTPTPPAGGAPSPTIQVEVTSIHFIFEGSCSSNPLCNHLYSLRHPSYQSGQGTMTINSDPENFLLGGHIRILPPSNVQHITISLLTDSVPELSAWTSARILLPPSAEFSQQTYIIK